MKANSWVFPPTRTCTDPAFSATVDIRLRKGTLRIDLTVYTQRQAEW